jgi:hypothetical protein
MATSPPIIDTSLQAPPASSTPPSPPKKRVPWLLIAAVIFFPISLSYLLLRTVWKGQLKTAAKLGVTGALALLWIIALVVSANSNNSGGTPTAATHPTVSAGFAKASATTAPTAQATPTKAAATTNSAVAQAVLYTSAVYNFTLKGAADNNAVSTACGAQDVAGCRTAATSLLVDLTAFKAQLAKLTIPTALIAVNTQLKAAIDTYIDGTQKEIQGIDSLNPDLITEGANLIQRANKELDGVTPLLTQAVAQLGG